MSQKFYHTSWLLLLLLLLGSKPITIAQTLLQRNYSGLPDGAQQTLHSEASRLTDLVNAYFRTTGFQVLDVGLYDVSLNMQGEQSFDVAFQTADAEVQGQAIPAARQSILRSKLNLNAYLLMVWQVAAGGRSLKLRWKLRLPDNGTIPPAELLELEGILTSMGSQVAEQQMANLGLGKWAEAAGDGVKKIADLLERKMRGEEVLDLYLTKITFKGFTAMDNQQNPEWTAEPGQEPKLAPLCYVQGTNMVLHPTIKCLIPLENNQKVRLKIKTQDGESQPIDLTYDGDLKTLQVGQGQQGISLFVKKAGARIESVEITWLINIGVSTEWQLAGSSKHKLFVLYKKPPTYVSSWKSSLIFFGCTYGKNILDDDAAFIDAIWQPFEGKNLNLKMFKPDQAAIPFTYYRTPGQGCTENIVDFPPVEIVNTTKVDGKEVQTKQLIIDGECGAFADLLESVLNAQGITSVVRKTIVPVTDKAFLVKKWEFVFKSEPNSSYPYQNKFNPNIMQGTDGQSEKTPRSSGNKYAQWATGVKVAIQDLPGEAGQNIDNPYSDFENHKVVKINQEVFDPSYGKRFKGGLVEWAKGSVAGFIGPYEAGLTPYYLFSAREVSDIEKEIKFK